MVLNLKNFAREIFILLGLDITKNLGYDRLSRLIIKKYIKDSFSCIDIGAHTGDFLRLFIRHSPHGNHFAFEPLPDFYNTLLNKYSDKATILPFAISNSNGTANFNYIRNAPSYSGLQRRKYNISNPQIDLINIEQRTLDSCIPEDIKIDLIKIDVEGGEYQVLEGAQRILQNYKPLILFECGLGASDYYGTKPEMVFDLLANQNYKIYLLPSWLKGNQPLTRDQFINIYHSKEEFFYLGS